MKTTIFGLNKFFMKKNSLVLFKSAESAFIP